MTNLTVSFRSFANVPKNTRATFLHDLQRLSFVIISLPTLNSPCSWESQHFYSDSKPNDIDGKLLSFFTKNITHILTWRWPLPTQHSIAGRLYFYLFLQWIVGRDGVVSIATRYWLDGPGIESRWGGGRDFSAPVQTDPGAHLVFCTMGTGSLFRGKAAGAWRRPNPI